MHHQNRQLREVELRIPLSAVETWGFEALVSIWQANEDDLRLQCLSCRGSHATMLVETSQPLDTAAFAAIDYITELRLVGRGPGRFEYLLETEAPCCQESLDECEGGFFVKDGPILSETGIEFTVVATQETLRLFDVGDVDSVACECEVLSLTEYTGRRDPLDTLTERQRTVLETAYAIGYYAVPRRISSDELAADLGLEKSTVLEHLRRAERNVLSELLDTEGHRASRSQRDARTEMQTQTATQE